jgi:hypothetical protein
VLRSAAGFRRTLAPGLVDDIDRLVRQLAVVDVRPDSSTAALMASSV